MNFHLPTVPYSAIDFANRRAAATGSVGYAMRTAGADYNGHSISITWNSYRGYWIAEHYWGERFVWCRGSLVDCLRAASEYHGRGAKGAAVSVAYPQLNAHDRDRPTESVMQFNAICAAAGYTFGSLYVIEREQGQPSWWTPKHDAVADAFSSERWFPGLVGLACNLKDGEDWQVVSKAYISGLRRPMAG